MVVSISTGYGVDYLTKGVAQGREQQGTRYYTGATTSGEPPGRWYGRGAQQLGLAGDVDHQDLRALYEHMLDPRAEGFRDPQQWSTVPTLGGSPRHFKTADELYAERLAREPTADAERRAALRLDADKAARQNVAFLDVTYSVQKSVTVLHTAIEAQEVKARAAGDSDTADAWAAHRQAVEDAIWAGFEAGIDYLEEKAGYTRAGHHGGEGGWWVDGHRLTVAAFFQHDSRDHDPQLHIHGATLNRMLDDEGEWRTLDSRALHRWKPAAAAVAERTTEERLQQTLPVVMRMRPDGKAREIVGIDQSTLDLFSSRHRAITPKTAELVRVFRAKFGRDPNGLELDRLARQATLATRRAKEHSPQSREEWLRQWDEQLRAEVDGGLAALAQSIVHEPRSMNRDSRIATAEPFDERDVIERAVAAVQDGKAAWTRADLTRQINAALPDRLGDLEARQIAELVDGLTDKAIEQHAVRLDADMPGDATLPAALRLRDGRSSFAAPGGERYATAQQLHAETVLRAAARDQGAARLSGEQARLVVDQLAEQGIELGADQRAALRGVLTSGGRVETLVGPAGTGKSFTVGTIAYAWQDERLWGGEPHRVYGLAASQNATETLAGDGVTARNITRWLDTQARLAAGRPRGDDQSWQLRAGDLVVVDESAMADTGSLARIHRIVDGQGGKLLLVGDHRQLAAVGAAGGMDLAVNHDSSYELTEARRFQLPWERDASLRLREGDPAGLQAYRAHGRIIDSGTIEHANAEVTRAWVADHLRGKNVIAVVDTNEQAAALSSQIRAELIRLGLVEERGGVKLDRDGQHVGPGDIASARHNGWELAGWDGNKRGPINRERYRVTETRDDGSLTVESLKDGERLRLPSSYVQDHVSLGYASTVHSVQSLTVDTSHTIATERTSPEAFYVGMSRGTQANTAHVVTLRRPDDAPPGMVNDTPHRDPAAVLANAAERHDIETSATAEHEQSQQTAESLKTAQERFTASAERYTMQRAGTWLDRLTSDGALSQAKRQEAAADPTMIGLANILRRAEIAGHDPEQVLRRAATQRSLEDANSVPSVLHSRIAEQVDLTPHGDRFADWVPRGADRAWQKHLSALAAEADRRIEQQHEDRREATVTATRELQQHDGEQRLPAAPRPREPERYALWRAAWRAEGKPEERTDEAGMSDGQLRMRFRAYEREKSWAPHFVAHEMSGTHQAAARHRADAALHQAEGREQDAQESDALARLHAERAVELERADEARAAWYRHTAHTREAADRAWLELSKRGVDPHQMERPTTPRQWLAEHRADLRRQDQRRILEEHDLVKDRAENIPADIPARSRDADASLGQAQQQNDRQQQTRADEAELGPVEHDRREPQDDQAHRDEQHQRHESDHTETAISRSATDRPFSRYEALHSHENDRSPETVPSPPDIRERGSRQLRREPRGEGDWSRVPSAAETRQSVDRAAESLREMRNRQAHDHEADHSHEREWEPPEIEHDGGVAERIPSLVDD